MATPFSRTIRSLETEHGSWPMLVLGSAMLLALLWGHWFFSARLISYAVSDEVYVTAREGRLSRFGAPHSGRRIEYFKEYLIVAKFPPDALASIHAGQKAWLRLAGDEAAGPVAAEVVGTAQGTAQLRAELPEAVPLIRVGAVRIETASATPALLVLRASGLLTESPRLSASPQTD